MQYAYMYAYHAVKKSETPIGTPIDLHFKNLVTVLDITVQGPETGEITVTNVNVKAVDGANVILTGDFTCNIRGAKDNSKEVTATCTPTGDLNAVRNSISISCYDTTAKDFITLKAGEQLNVKAYIIPDSENAIKAQQLQITVNTQNGAANVKTLATTDVTPHKVNRVRLPQLRTGGTDYWMSNLDPNIYVTELSWPGSKMSLLTADNKADIKYQDTDISEQLQDGVRAFIFQVQLYNTGSTWRPNYNELHLSVDGTALSLKLEDGLRMIANFLDTAEALGKKESAFVLVTYNGLSNTTQSQWFNLLQSTINTCANNSSYRIFNGDLSPNTTLGDVANKIIVKANYNSADMIASAGIAPMLHTLWTTGHVDGGVDMTWRDPDGSKAFTWLYQEVTNVWDETGTNPGTEATKTQKTEWITTIFNESLEAYKTNDAHDIWFMNDLGGYFNNGRTKDVIALTKEMNALGIRQLQERTENASLGLIYMNFANSGNTGMSYGSTNLISTIIDNNFKFALRKKGDSSSRSYNASYANGGNAIGWDE